MAVYDTHRTYGAGQTYAGRTVSFFSALTGSVASWNDQRQTRKALSQLTDRELDDIGLIRGDIDRI